MKEIGLLSVDQRQIYANKILNQKGYSSKIISNMDFNHLDIVVCGIPIIKMSEYLNCDFHSAFPIDTFLDLLKPGQLLFGGGITPAIRSKLHKKNISFTDFLEDPYFVWKNAYLTAEGLIGKIINDTDFSLRNKNVLLIGFGKCGMNIAKLLEVFHCDLFIYDHTLGNTARASSFGYQIILPPNFNDFLKHCDLIINTVPKKVLSDFHYEIIKKNCFLYEIASYPYGLDQGLATEHDLSFYTCPGIPGKYASKSAGEIIAKTIISNLERNQ